MTMETLPIAPYSASAASVAGAGPDGITLSPECSTPEFLYAVEWVAAAKRHIYRRRLDGALISGNVWEQKNAVLVNITKICALSDGGILINVGTAVHYSADGGATTRQVATLTASQSISGWGDYRYLDNGTWAVFGEYATGKKVWRASLADLAGSGSFASVTSIFAGVTHFHGISWHAGTQRWLAFCGDGKTASLNAYSEDNGATWTAFEAIGATSGLHPMTGVDVGHATELVTGQDGFGGVLRYNTSNGRARRVGVCDPRAGHYYVFGMWYENGLVYALTAYSAAPTDKKGLSIYISPDLGETWCSWLRLPTTLLSAFIRGIVDGKIQLDGWTGTNHVPYEVAEPTVIRRGAMLALPAGINTLPDAAASFEPDGVGGWYEEPGPPYPSRGVTIERTTEDAWHGSACLKVRIRALAPATTYPSAQSPAVACVGGQYIFARAYVKAVNKKGPIRATIRFNSGLTASAPYSEITAVEDSWTEVSIGPTRVLAGETSAYVWIQADVAQGSWAIDDYFLIDGVEMYVVAANTCPSRWVLKDSPRAATAYSFTKTLAAAWTCILTWSPDNDGNLAWPADKTVSAVAATEYWTSALHGYETRDAVRLTGTMPVTDPQVVEGTTYYVRKVDGNSVTLYDTAAHAATGGATGLISVTNNGECLIARDLTAFTTKHVIASWKADANNWAILYFDPGDGGKFNLQVTDDNGATSEVISIAAATWWQKDSTLRFAIRHDGADVSLSVANGGTVAHCAATVDGEYAGLAGAAVTFCAGHTDGSAILPGLFRSIRFWPSELTDGEVLTEMGLSELAYPNYGVPRVELAEDLVLAGLAGLEGSIVAQVDATIDGADATSLAAVAAGCDIFANGYSLTVQNLGDVPVRVWNWTPTCTDGGGNGAGVVFHPGTPSALAMMGCGV